MRWRKLDPPIAPGGDVGCDGEVTDSWDVRFRPESEPADGLHALVTDTFYGVDEGSGIRLERQTEFMICGDLSDPGSTEEWSDLRYANLGGRWSSVEAAFGHARALAEADDGAHIRWNGRRQFIGSRWPR